MINHIKEKLRKVLSEELDEPKAVFALVKIRKILEDDSVIKGKYKYLNLYSNWALHIKIDDSKLIPDFIKDLKDEDGEIFSFKLHIQFLNELKEFCKNECGFDISIDKDKLKQVRNILDEVYLETPLIFRDGKELELGFVLKDYKGSKYYAIQVWEKI